jgi:hypothetical protein
MSGCFLFFDSRIQALNSRGVETRESIRAQGNQLIVAAAELRQHFAFDHGLGSMRRSFEDYRKLMIDMGKLAGWFQALAPVVATIQIDEGPQTIVEALHITGNNNVPVTTASARALACFMRAVLRVPIQDGSTGERLAAPEY